MKRRDSRCMIPFFASFFRGEDGRHAVTAPILGRGLTAMLQEAAVEAGDAFKAGILADLGDAALGLQKQQPTA